jgi:hypothetical protein
MSRNSREKRNRRAKQKRKDSNRRRNGRSGSANGRSPYSGLRSYAHDLFGKGRSLRSLDFNMGPDDAGWVMSAIERHGLQSSCDLLEMMDNPVRMRPEFEDAYLRSCYENLNWLFEQLVDLDAPVSEVERIIEDATAGRVPVAVRGNLVERVGLNFSVLYWPDEKEELKIPEHLSEAVENARADPLYSEILGLMALSSDDPLLRNKAKYLISLDTLGKIPCQLGFA